MKKILALAAFGCVAAASYGQNNFQLGVTAGWYIPTSTTLKNAFGSQIFTIGVTPVASGRPASGSLTPNFQIIGASKDGSNFLLIPVTLGYEYHFTNDSSGSSFVPYARIEAGGSYYNYSISEGAGPNVKGSRFGYVADAELGLIVTSTIHVSAKYYLFQQQSGINFNGFQLGVTLSVLKL